MSAVAAQAREAAIHCEAKKISYRQSARDGLVVSFSIHPSDMPAQLATADLGQRYMLALVAIGDDEKPVAVAEPPHAPQPVLPEDAPPAEMSAKAVQRAGMLPNDIAFQRWIQGFDPSYAAATKITAARATELLRERLGIASRREIERRQLAYDAFIALESDFLRDAGRRPA